MIKTLKQALKSDKESLRIPRSVQETIPIKRIWPDGMIQVGGKFSKTFRFADINYSVASKDDQMAMFLDYCELLNSLEVGATTKITLNNRRLNRENFVKNLLPMREDGLDHYRDEYNKMLMDKAMSGSGIVQEKYITVSVLKQNHEEAKIFFARVAAELSARFARLSSKCEELDITERMRIFHDFFRTGQEEDFRFELSELMRKGHSFADSICPDSIAYRSGHIKIGEKYARVLYLREYPSYIKDSMITELCEMNRSLMLSIDIIPVPTDEAVKEVENRLLGTETNITNWQRKQNQNSNFSAVVPYDLEQQRQESKEFLDDLTTRDQRMMFVVVTLVHVADTKEQLDTDTEALLSVARKHICQFETLKYQQMEGLNTVLPYGLRKIDALRTLTTESTAVLMPFRAQEINHRDGIYCGQNAISKNLIFVNRSELLNGNGFILGVSGAGKSFFAKREIINLVLRGGANVKDGADVIIIDPEREYSFVRELGGEVIHIAAGSKNHINAMDMAADYADTENPVILKSEFVLSLCEQLVGSGKLTAKEKSLIDRCTAFVYRPYIMQGCTGTPPTLKDFHRELLLQPEPEAKDVALAIELFTNGSLDTFARQTNVDTENSLICYDIRDLGKALKTVGMLVVMDSIYNRIVRNKKKCRPTYVFIDEIYLLFANEYSANFLFEQWKRARKHNAFYTGISQNVEDMLQSHTARTMLANSEFIVMLNQAATDRLELAKLLGISDTQLSFVTNAGAGKGLLKCAGSIVPFEDKYPAHTELYRLMTTKPNEKFVMG
ncbi:MAG: TraE family protein [Clostridiales bacterium]|nr:MAG: TraE family protein [Clostridiales bacterium]